MSYTSTGGFNNSSGGGGGGSVNSVTATAPIVAGGTATDPVISASYNAANAILKLSASAKIAANMIPSAAAGNGINVDASTGVISVSTTLPNGYTMSAAGTALAVTNNASVGGTLTLGALTAAGASALPITANAASTWSTSAGALTIDGFAGTTIKLNTATKMDVGVTSSSAVTLAAGVSYSGAAGSGALSLGSMTGDSTLTTGALTYAGASGKAAAIGTTAANLTLSTTTSGTLAITSAGACNISAAAASTIGTTSANLTVSTTTSGTLAVTSAGALTLTGAGASTWSLSSGALTVQTASANLTIQTTTSGTLLLDSAAALNVGTTGATSVTISRSGQATAVQGRFTSQQDFQLSGVQSPASFSTDQTDYNPASFANCSLLRLTPTANVKLNSLASRNGMGFRYTIVNLATSNTLTLLHDDGATGTAAQRFLCPNAANYVIPTTGAVDIIYDNTSSRWRVIGPVA